MNGHDCLAVCPLGHRSYHRVWGDNIEAVSCPTCLGAAVLTRLADPTDDDGRALDALMDDLPDDLRDDERVRGIIRSTMDYKWLVHGYAMNRAIAEMRARLRTAVEPFIERLPSSDAT